MNIKSKNFKAAQIIRAKLCEKSTKRVLGMRPALVYEALRMPRMPREHDHLPVPCQNKSRIFFLIIIFFSSFFKSSLQETNVKRCMKLHLNFHYTLKQKGISNQRKEEKNWETSECFTRQGIITTFAFLQMSSKDA